MLKKLSFLALICLVGLTSCKDEDAAPIIEFDQLEIGAFPRLVALNSGEFDLNNKSTSLYSMDVDFVDGADGSEIEQYNVFARFDGNDTETEFALLKTLTPSDFSAGPNGNLGTQLVITFEEVATFTGVNIDDIVAGERFQIRTEVVKSNGRTFNSVNSTPAVTNAFGGIWNFNINATCPLDEDFYVGTYGLSYGFVYDEIPSLFGGGQNVQALGDLTGVTVDLGLVAGSSTRRSFVLGERVWLPFYGFDAGTITLEFICDVVESSNIAGAASCDGSGSLGAVQTGTASFSFDSDETLTIEYSDFALGGCRSGTLDYSLVFTKQ